MLSTRIDPSDCPGFTFYARWHNLPDVFPTRPFIYFLTQLCRPLCTASHLHDATTQLPLTEFFIGCIFSNDPCRPLKARHRHIVMPAAPHLHQPADIATLSAAPAAPAAC